MGKKRKSHPTDKYTEFTIQMASPIPGTQKIYVIWVNGEEAVVDISKIIENNKWFKPLQDSTEFQTAKIADWGSGVEWQCEAGIGSDEVRWMADKQKSVLRKKNKKKP